MPQSKNNTHTRARPGDFPSPPGRCPLGVKHRRVLLAFAGCLCEGRTVADLAALSGMDLGIDGVGVHLYDLRHLGLVRFDDDRRWRLTFAGLVKRAEVRKGKCPMTKHE